MRTTSRGLGVIAALVLVAGTFVPSALADTVTFDIGPFSEPGFSASGLHTAPSGGVRMPDGHKYYMGGTNTYTLTGEIVAEVDYGAGTLDFVGGSLLASSLGFCGSFLGFDLSEDIEIAITGGGIQKAGPDDRPQGFLETRWSQMCEPDKNVKFYFAPFDFSGSANGFLESDMGEFTLWGNNTTRFDGKPPRNSSSRIGIDLYGKARTSSQQQPAPEPGTALLLGSAVAAAAVIYRRQRRRAA